MELNKVYNEDCLIGMDRIKDKSIDMILCDLPYGITACKWDVIIPFDKLWEQYNRIIKDNGAIVLTASQPFTTLLIASNIKNYRHNWVWNKNNSSAFMLAKIRPLNILEDIIVFGKNKVNYYPIKEQRGKPRKKGGYSKSDNYGITPSESFNNEYYPKNLLNFTNASQKNKKHPTQKPIELFEYLIKTYTKENETVLDNCIGSGTTAIACINTNRNYIGFEMDKEYFRVASERIDKHNKELNCKASLF